ncbi:ABC transporter ATP-binding protein [Collimonas sp. OK412]|jgi:branched-chain amino acid transport system ATP-binding protein|uniref:ABC transporter ATP-binding protein n=1 Tax=Collimonas sp. (strain OK412) TaxID=1801619 RepID=UPI0008EA73FB|nr:ABC transporter ATP-binding protein [Collimonas sp. OK412]SFB92728.1 amino acid/amide ABC transporter ATP-binding protein 2, HAAT family (TC 3.A.1.4.-) [Collimonas sp. OK412]
MTAMLEVRGLHAFYGQSHVLHGVDLDVGPGEIVSLLGRNGAGRSSTLKAIMGMLRSSGSVRFDGIELNGLKTFRIARQGLAYVPEERAVFPTLTVEQNLLLGQQRERVAMDDMWRLMPQLAARRHVAAGLLSGGEQQMLSLCRSLMGKPRLVMVDEPTEGLAPHVVQAVAQHLLALRAQGLGVLLVEQKLGIALDISDRVLVMGHGQVVFTGTPAELRANPEVRRKWLEV